MKILIIIKVKPCHHRQINNTFHPVIGSLYISWETEVFLQLLYNFNLMNDGIHLQLGQCTNMNTTCTQSCCLILTLSCPDTGRATVKIGLSNLRPGSKELTPFTLPVLHSL